MGRRRAVEWFNSARRHGGGDFLLWLKHALQMLAITKGETKNVVAFLKYSPVPLRRQSCVYIYVRRPISKTEGRFGCVLSITNLEDERKMSVDERAFLDWGQLVQTWYPKSESTQKILFSFFLHVRLICAPPTSTPADKRKASVLDTP